jgi:hypothetical protein
MHAAAALTKNRGDGGAPMDSVEGKRSSVTESGQMMPVEGVEAFGMGEQDEELTHGRKLRRGEGIVGAFVPRQRKKWGRLWGLDQCTVKER